MFIHAPLPYYKNIHTYTISLACFDTVRIQDSQATSLPEPGQETTEESAEPNVQADQETAEPQLDESNAVATEEV